MYYRLISLLLVLSMLLGGALALTGCGADTPGDDTTPPIGGGGGKTEKSIIVPEFKDYDKKTVRFDEIEYARPDAEKLISDFSSVTDVITANEIPYDDQLGAILSLEDGYLTFRTMYSYSNILMSKDASNTYWCDEYSYISGFVPLFTSTIEKMFVAAAQSEHALRFEEDYFGDGLIEEYADGGIYTDALVKLMEEETEIENRYSSLSTASVVITYKSMTDTFDNIVAFFVEAYGEGTLTYSLALEECAQIYEARVNELSREMLVELFKVRKKIALELGYTSYADYAYETIYHDYTKEQMLGFIKDVSEYVIPVYYSVSYYVLWPYFDQLGQMPTVDKVDLINTLYYAYEDMDAELHDIYSYMLQFGLYDIEGGSDNRFAGSFCTYLDSYEAPYVFLSTDGGCEDYMTLAHEFGHFVDSFINSDASTSMDLLEVSSQALEYLTLTEIRDDITEEEYKFLLYSQISSSFDVLLFQSFYALFEHYAYDIAYDSITGEELVRAMKRAAEDMGMSSDYFDSLDHVLIPHIMLYPFYVQSYTVSASVSLEIHYVERANDGAGLEAYLELVEREDDSLTLEENLREAGLTSPFSKNYLKALADMIHYDIMGAHFYKESTDQDNAA